MRETLEFFGRLPSRLARVSLIAMIAVLSQPAGAFAAPLVGSMSGSTRLAFEFANYWAQENEGSVTIGVVRSGESNLPVTVDYATVDGLAKAGQAFIATSGTLAFSAGEKVKLFSVPILNDGVRNGTRTFTINLLNPTGGAALSTPRTVSVTLNDNDPGVQFTRNQLWVLQQAGSATLSVTRGNDGLLGAFTVDYTTADGTAKAGIDYTPASGQLAFSSGEMTRSLTVQILDDGVARNDRQFKVLLSNVAGPVPMASTTVTTATVNVCDTREMLPHRFDSLQVLPDESVLLKFTGGFTPGLGLSNRFHPFFDVFPVETSTNLLDWTPLAWLVRTNAATNDLSLRDLTAADHSGRRFYRTPTASFVTPLRPPPGPYRVGFTDRTINDETRRNRFRISTNGSFPITIWYPAKTTPGQAPIDAYEPESLARDPRPGAEEGFVDRAPYLKRYAMQNAPAAEGAAAFPILFWSSGYLWARHAAAEWAEHIASYGYVVVSVDHFDSCIVDFPDGRYLFTPYADTLGREPGSPGLQDRVRDCVITLDEMTRWNQDDALLAGRLDTQSVAAMGWSYGSDTSVEFCRIDPRVEAAIALEGYFESGAGYLSGFAKPVLSIYQEASSYIGLFAHLKSDAVFFQIRYTDHDSFNTYYWQFVAPPLLERRREAARTRTDYALWFLNKYLKGSSDSMPDAANYPQLFNLKKK